MTEEQHRRAAHAYLLWLEWARAKFPAIFCTRYRWDLFFEDF